LIFNETIKPVIDSAYLLEDALEAYAHGERDEQFEKIVLKVC
jgi:NADPH:quinone reductase-like Zn-dependent oxidoreductase